MRISDWSSDVCSSDPAAVAAAVQPPCTENCGPVATPLTNMAPVSGLAGAAGSEVLYSFEAQAGATLSFMTYGGSGDVSMYVSFEAEPTTSDYDRSEEPTSELQSQIRISSAVFCLKKNTNN